MDPQTYYKIKLHDVNEELKKRLKRKSGFGFIRFGNILFIAVVLFLTWNSSVAIALLLSFLLLVVFVIIVRADVNNRNQIEHLQFVIEVINKEELSEQGSYKHFNAGDIYKNKNHPYSDDLDLFGSGSLFQFLNRCESEPGEDMLSSWLLNAASIDDIKKRQQGVTELSLMQDLLIESRALALKKKFSNQAAMRLEEWVNEPQSFSGFVHWRWIRYVVPVLMGVVLGLFILGILSLGMLILALVLSGTISYRVNRKLAPIHNSLSFMVKELKVLSERLMLFECAKFSNPELVQLQQQLMKGGIPASKEIGKLEGLMSRLDLLYNMLLSAPLNLLLLWNLQQILDLEKWKRDKNEEVGRWVNVLSQFESLASFSTILFNHPKWVFPEVVDPYFVCEGKNLGHPLIDQKKRVNNDIEIDGHPHIMLITGSNMAGKSTFLRTVGVNTVLAMAGAPVCATGFKISHVQLMSSMRIADNLEESTSTFYAELKKLKQVIDAANAGDHIFILLDEILRGTNSHDRHTGSRALISQLIKKGVVALVATHDLELTTYTQDYQKEISNFYFDVTVQGEDLSFDYKLKPGVCSSMNASILMKKIGIDL